jgi:hypothetical protein
MNFMDTTYFSTFFLSFGQDKYLCGSGGWHKSGIDCRGCEETTAHRTNPEPREEQSLCGISGMTNFPTWGVSIKQCNDAPAASK